MKKIENLGKTLSKEEQKKIKGGPIDPGCSGSCDVKIDGVNHPGTCSTVDNGHGGTLCYCSSGLTYC